MRALIVLVALSLALVACGAVPTPTPIGAGPSASGDSVHGSIRRVRFEEDRVTCYQSFSGNLRCLQDRP